MSNVAPGPLVIVSMPNKYLSYFYNSTQEDQKNAFAFTKNNMKKNVENQYFLVIIDQSWHVHYYSVLSDKQVEYNV